MINELPAELQKLCDLAQVKLQDHREELSTLMAVLVAQSKGDVGLALATLTVQASAMGSVLRVVWEEKERLKAENVKVLNLMNMLEDGKYEQRTGGEG